MDETDPQQAAPSSDDPLQKRHAICRPGSPEEPTEARTGLGCQSEDIPDPVPSEPTRPRLAPFVVAPLVAVFLVCAILLACPFIENRGPDSFLGRGDGCDIHRHDFVYRFGWPMAAIEQSATHWYCWIREPPHGVRSPTNDEKRAWVTQRATELRAEGATAELAQLAGDPYGTGRVIRWPALIGDLLFWSAVCGAISFSCACLLTARRRRQHRQGLCVTCGYDLRASRQFGRCPECGTRC